MKRGGIVKVLGFLPGLMRSPRQEMVVIPDNAELVSMDEAVDRIADQYGASDPARAFMKRVNRDVNLRAVLRDLADK